MIGAFPGNPPNQPSPPMITPKFLFYFKVESLKTGCCCGMCTLKTGVQVLAILSIVYGNPNPYE